MDFNLVITIVGLMASLSSIVFAFLAFKRSERQDQKDEGKSQGQIMSDIGYIKACVDRMEKNLNIVDERYRNIVERLVKVEEGLANLQNLVLIWRVDNFGIGGTKSGAKVHFIFTKAWQCAIMLVN